MCGGVGCTLELILAPCAGKEDSKGGCLLRPPVSPEHRSCSCFWLQRGSRAVHSHALWGPELPSL